MDLLEMTNNKIHNLKALPIPPPPSPSLSLSESHQYYTHLKQLEASNLIPFPLFTSIKLHNTSFFLSFLSLHSRTVHISELMKRVTRAGNTVLHLAAIFENLHILEPIPEHFPHLITEKNIKGDTVLHVAARSHDAELIRIVLKCYDRHFASNNNEVKEPNILLLNHWSKVGSQMKIQSLGRSVPGRRTNTDKEILEEPKSKIISTHELLKDLVRIRPELIYLKDEKGNTPLHCAAAMGDVEDVRIIANANPASALEWNEKGYLPIHVACRKGHVSVVKLLVQQPWFDPMESLNPKGQNILHIAAKRGKDRVVKYVLREKKLEVGSLLNQKDKNGNTPLHLASKYLFPKVLLLLAQQKSLDVNLLNNDDMTARDIVMLIRKSPPTIRELLSYAILNSIGAPLSHKGRKLRRSQHKTPQVKWIKDRVSTILLVAILVATVTFAAGFTMPGGFHDSDNKDIKKLGTATLLNRRMFQLFTICDVVAMYSSTMGSFILLWAQLGDFHLAFSATYVALYLVGLALVTMQLLSWLLYIWWWVVFLGLLTL